MARLQSYSAQVAAGKVVGGAVPAIEKLGSSAARVDANDGFAFPAFDLAIDALVEMTEETPVAGIAVTNSHHFGVAGHHVERLAERGVAGLVFGNSPPALPRGEGHGRCSGQTPLRLDSLETESHPLSWTSHSRSKLAARSN